MKKIENKVMLITYSDSMGKNLKELDQIVGRHFSKAIGGIHILPFSLHQVTEGLHRLIIIKWIRHLETGKMLKNWQKITILCLII